MKLPICPNTYHAYPNTGQFMPLSLQIAPVGILTDEEMVLKPEQKETVTSGEGVTISPASIDES